MLNQKDKLERFAAVINRDAAEQCRFIEKQTKSLEEKQLKEIEKQSKAELEASMNYEIAKIRQQFNREISSLKSESRKRRVAHREKLTDEVFALAKERLVSFTGTPDYEQFLKKSVKELLNDLGEGCILLVRKEDEAIIEKIKQEGKLLFTVECDSQNSLGGLKGISVDGLTRIDDTLQTRLDSQRDEFSSSCSLSIN